MVKALSLKTSLAEMGKRGQRTQDLPGQAQNYGLHLKGNRESLQVVKQGQTNKFSNAYSWVLAWKILVGLARPPNLNSQKVSGTLMQRLGAIAVEH